MWTLLNVVGSLLNLVLLYIIIINLVRIPDFLFLEVIGRILNLVNLVYLSRCFMVFRARSISRVSPLRATLEWYILLRWCMGRKVQPFPPPEIEKSSHGRPHRGACPGSGSRDLGRARARSANFKIKSSLYGLYWFPIYIKFSTVFQYILLKAELN